MIFGHSHLDKKTARWHVVPASKTSKEIDCSLAQPACFVDCSSSYVTNTLWCCMQYQCIDLPLDSLPWLYAVASPPTTANEQSITPRCLWPVYVAKLIYSSGFYLLGSPILLDLKSLLCLLSVAALKSLSYCQQRNCTYKNLTHFVINW